MSAHTEHDPNTQCEQQQTMNEQQQNRRLRTDGHRVGGLKYIFTLDSAVFKTLKFWRFPKIRFVKNIRSQGIWAGSNQFCWLCLTCSLDLNEEFRWRNKGSNAASDSVVIALLFFAAPIMCVWLVFSCSALWFLAWHFQSETACCYANFVITCSRDLLLVSWVVL